MSNDSQQTTNLRYDDVIQTPVGVGYVTGINPEKTKLLVTIPVHSYTGKRTIRGTCAIEWVGIGEVKLVESTKFCHVVRSKGVKRKI